MLSTRYSRQILVELEGSRQILEKILSYFTKICRVEAEAFHAEGDGWTDGRTRRS